MVVAAMQGANQHIRSSLGFSILPKDTSTYRQGESDQQPSNKDYYYFLRYCKDGKQYIYVYIYFLLSKNSTCRAQEIITNAQKVVLNTISWRHFQ